MALPQEANVSSTQDSLYVSEENIKAYSSMVKSKLNSSCNDVKFGGSAAERYKVTETSNQKKKKVENVFPWLTSFKELQIIQGVGCTSIKVLENSLTKYLSHVSIEVKNCYPRPNRAAKLKKCLNEVLLLFHMQYQDLRESMSMEHPFYLKMMTELLSIYVDMQIKASWRRKKAMNKIAGKVTTNLLTFLNHNEYHILDVILKARLFTNANRELCIHILRCILSQIVVTKLHVITYIRRILVFKLWKKMEKDLEKKHHIVTMAVEKLTVPDKFLEKTKKEFVDILPRIPKSKKNFTLFYMKAKFNLKLSFKAFVKLCRDSYPCDKSMIFKEHLDESSIGVDMNDGYLKLGTNMYAPGLRSVLFQGLGESSGVNITEIGGAASKNNMFSNIWSGISLENCNSLPQKQKIRDKNNLSKIEGNKRKSQVKRRKESKTKSRINNNVETNSKNKIKKQKKLKNFLSASNDNTDKMITLLDNVKVINTNAIQSSEKEKMENTNKPATEKTNKDFLGSEQNLERNVKSEEFLVLKEEGNDSENCVNALKADILRDPEETENQVNKIDSAGLSQHPEEILDQINKISSESISRDPEEIINQVNMIDCSGISRVNDIEREPEEIVDKISEVISRDNDLQREPEEIVDQISEGISRDLKETINQVNKINISGDPEEIVNQINKINNKSLDYSDRNKDIECVVDSTIDESLQKAEVEKENFMKVMKLSSLRNFNFETQVNSCIKYQENELQENKIYIPDSNSEIIQVINNHSNSCKNISESCISNSETKENNFKEDAQQNVYPENIAMKEFSVTHKTIYDSVIVSSNSAEIDEIDFSPNTDFNSQEITKLSNKADAYVLDHNMLSTNITSKIDHSHLDTSQLSSNNENFRDIYLQNGLSSTRRKDYLQENDSDILKIEYEIVDDVDIQEQILQKNLQNSDCHDYITTGNDEILNTFMESDALVRKKSNDSQAESPILDKNCDAQNLEISPTIETFNKNDTELLTFINDNIKNDANKKVVLAKFGNCQSQFHSNYENVSIEKRNEEIYLVNDDKNKEVFVGYDNSQMNAKIDSKRFTHVSYNDYEEEEYIFRENSDYDDEQNVSHTESCFESSSSRSTSPHGKIESDHFSPYINEEQKSDSSSNISGLSCASSCSYNSTSIRNRNISTSTTSECGSKSPSSVSKIDSLTEENTSKINNAPSSNKELIMNLTKDGVTSSALNLHSNISMLKIRVKKCDSDTSAQLQAERVSRSCAESRNSSKKTINKAVSSVQKAHTLPKDSGNINAGTTISGRRRRRGGPLGSAKQNIAPNKTESDHDDDISLKELADTVRKGSGRRCDNLLSNKPALSKRGRRSIAESKTDDDDDDDDNISLEELADTVRKGSGRRCGSPLSNKPVLSKRGRRKIAESKTKDDDDDGDDNISLEELVSSSQKKKAKSDTANKKQPAKSARRGYKRRKR